MAKKTKMTKMDKIEKILYECYKKHCPGKTVAVSLSGGSDSMALAFAMRNLGLEYVAIIVDHKLRKSSSLEALSVARIMSEIGVQSKILTWDHDQVTNNFEGLAREARYELIATECSKIGINDLFVGHHMDDQIETFIINLSRGSGIDGLSCMTEITVKNDTKIIRPFLGIEKKELVSYLEDRGLIWFEDETNQDTSIKRNNIRNMLLNLEGSDIIKKRINLAINHIQQSKIVLDKHYQQTIGRVANLINDIYNIDAKEFSGLLYQEKISILSMIIIELTDSKEKFRLEQIDGLVSRIENNEEFILKLLGVKVQKNNNLVKVSKI